MTNPIYQAAVEELEQFLAPRVVSRALKDGLRQQNQTPETVGVEDFDEILKGSVFRQLQVSMPADKAKDTVAEILDRLKTVAEAGPEEEPESTDPSSSEAEEQEPAEPASTPLPQRSAQLQRQEEELVGLRAALKPFNLYFEWPEVQKLRAQVQVLKEEHERDREASGLIEEAHRQLSEVRQKLEDHVVIQARDLAELVEAFEQVQSLGGVKVRRLENLIGHIREAQESRQLAPAELERARKIAKDLRKLVESSVYQEQAGTEQGAGTSGTAAADLPAEVTQRLDRLDRESEQHEIQRLRHEYANLLDHLPELSERLQGLRSAVAAGKGVDADLAELRNTLAEATETQRTALREEFSQVKEQAQAMPAAVDTSELLQAVTVAQGVLDATLPNIEDTKYIRRLHRLALEKREELERYEEEAEAERVAGIDQQRALVVRARATVERHADREAEREILDDLVKALAALEPAASEARLVPDLAGAVRRAEERLEAAVAEHADDARVRERAQLRALLTKVEGLPSLPALSARIGGVKRELVRLIDESEDSGVDQVQIEAIRSLVGALRRDAIDTCRSRLEQLAEHASEIDAEELLGRIQSANNVLDDDVYPDVKQLEIGLRQLRDAHREEQFAQLRRLERDATEYVETGLDEAERLERFLAMARERLETGGVATDLQQGRDLLQHVQNTVERRLADFEPRLDAALAAFQHVAMLNSEDVATVRRNLKHLDSQRDAFPRVSTGLRIQLERALEASETLLAKLQDEVDATRAIADRLMSGNILDDVLGLFTTPAAAGGDGRDPVDGAKTSEPSADPVVDWLASFTREAGVRGGAIAAGGRWLAGALPHDPERIRSTLSFLSQNLTRVGDQLQHGPLRIATLELEAQILVVAWLDGDSHLLLLLDSATVLSLVGHRLRTELDELQRLLHDSSDA